MTNVLIFLVNMTLHVKKSGGDAVSIEVAVSETIEIVKKKINEEVGTSVDRQILSFGGHEMDDTATLSDYKVSDKSTIDLVIGKGIHLPIVPCLCMHTNACIYIGLICSDYFIRVFCLLKNVVLPCVATNSVLSFI